jgi:hypothetical protein
MHAIKDSENNKKYYLLPSEDDPQESSGACTLPQDTQCAWSTCVIIELKYRNSTMDPLQVHINM